MKYIKELNYDRPFQERTRLLKRIIEQDKQIREQQTYIKHLEELLNLQDMQTQDVYTIAKWSTSNGVIDVKKCFNKYEIFMSHKKNKLDDQYVDYYIDQYKNDGSTENSS
jgi:hypothetical protein